MSLNTPQILDLYVKLSLIQTNFEGFNTMFNLIANH
jgi:hypothetical protein